MLTVACQRSARPQAIGMGTNTPKLCFGLALAALLVGSILPSAAAQNVLLTVPQTNGSGHNQMLDFYAGGTSDGYSLRISPQGGTLTVGDYLSMNLMPWGYVTAQWATGKTYVIFLVNVTQTNFRIGFLYLTNSSDEPFILRWFDYASDNIQVWTFQGIQHVYNRTVATASVSLPKLQIPAAAKVTNGLSALGQQFYLSSRSGEWLNGTSTLSIYPLFNQYFSGANDYNEVWSLLVDSLGNYYFAILYMQNSNVSHVIIEHQLRLNDYVRLQGQTIDARWVLGDFIDKVTIRTGVPNVMVKVDGFPFQANQNGVVSTSVPSGALTLEVPSEISGSDNTKMSFSNWGKFGSSNPIRVTMNSTVDITAKYTKEYAVSVNSPYGAPQGSGWYLEGTNVTFAVDSTLNFGNGTRRVFQQWTGDSNSTSPQAWIEVNSAKQVTAEWKTQYALTISAPGLPTNASTNVLVGDQSVTLNGPTPVTEWVDANQQLAISVRNQHIQAPSGNYSFAELRADNQTFAGIVVVTEPITIWLMYSATPNSAPSISPRVFSNQMGAPTTTNPGILATVLGNGLMVARNVPVIAPMISLTASLANLGHLLAAFIVPGGSPIVGYLLGSLFVGLIYVLPVSALALLYRSAKTKRQPSLRTLTPLVIVWAISLALILLSSNVGVLQSLAATLQILLMLTTMLLFPLVIAFRLAKLVA
jgi:hypothetical protein